jgi:hypothetical protein
MTATIHPAAPQNIPFYLPGADGSDPIFTIVTIILVLALMAVGVLYFKIHSLPEQLAEKHNNSQVQLIMVLTLLAMFTHNNIFWVLALLLAVVRFPDFLTPLTSIADSLKKLTADEAKNEAALSPTVTPTTASAEEEG